jgi:hypothetical protein
MTNLQFLEAFNFRDFGSNRFSFKKRLNVTITASGDIVVS